MNLENTKIYTTDTEVIRKYAELCGRNFDDGLTGFDCDIVGVAFTTDEEDVGWFSSNSTCHNDHIVTTITPDQINALYDDRFGNHSEAPNGSKWDNGDECIYMTHNVVQQFIGADPKRDGYGYIQAPTYEVNLVELSKLSKPETPEQREERERVIKLRTMAEDAMKDIDAEDGDHSTVDGVVFRMIAAGYRKQKDGE